MSVIITLLLAMMICIASPAQGSDFSVAGPGDGPSMVPIDTDFDLAQTPMVIDGIGGDGVLIEIEKWFNRHLAGESTVNFTVKPGSTKSYKIHVDDGFTLSYDVEVRSGPAIRFMVLDDENHSAYESGQPYTALVNVSSSSIQGSVGLDEGRYHLLFLNEGGSNSNVTFTTNANIDFMICLIIIGIVALVIVVIILFTVYKLILFTGSNRRQKRESKRRMKDSGGFRYSLDDISQGKDEDEDSKKP